MSLLRSCSSAMASALAGGVPLWSADLFQLTLVDGTTNYYWTTWDTDLLVGSQVYSCRQPWIKRSKWNVVNTMEVPTLNVSLMALNGAFAGGANIKTQIHNGVFDGASLTLSRAYMTTPGATAALGVIDLFGGMIGSIDLTGTQADLTVKGKVNNLDQYVPRNTYQAGCNHAFCDAGCSLSRASFTASYTVGSSPTVIFIPWSSAPSNPGRYRFGTLAVTSGAAAGQRRTIQGADSSGLTLAYPLYAAPAPGDSFTAFQGCDKTFNSGSGQSCTDRSNTQHYRGFPFVPPPTTAY